MDVKWDEKKVYICNCVHNIESTWCTFVIVCTIQTVQATKDFCFKHLIFVTETPSIYSFSMSTCKTAIRMNVLTSSRSRPSTRSSHDGTDSSPSCKQQKQLCIYIFASRRQCLLYKTDQKYAATEVHNKTRSPVWAQTTRGKTANTDDFTTMDGTGLKSEA